MKFYSPSLILAIVMFFGLSFDAQAQNDQYENFGSKITMKKAQPISKGLKQLDKKGDLNIKLEGTIEEVCAKKGCWMNLVDDKTGEQVFVKFRDYGFFVPKDSAGKKAIMQGTLMKEVTSVEELRHFAEDAKKSPEEIAAITEPKEEVKFIADGVIIF